MLQEIEYFPLDWRTTIHWKVVSTIFQLNHICLDCWKTVGSIFQCMVDLQSKGMIYPVIFLLLWTISPSLEINDTLKCWSNNFPTTLTCIVKVDNCQNSISMNGYSPIKQNKFKFLLKFNQARILECNIRHYRKKKTKQKNSWTKEWLYLGSGQ